MIHRLLIVAGLAACLTGCSSSTRARLDTAGEEYLKATFNADPGAGTAAGLHEYDGKTIDLSAPAIAAHHAELVRLRASFNDVMASAGSDRESRLRARALVAAIDAELFKIDALHAYTRNPMTYAGAIDASIYAKRDFAPKAERLRSAIGVLKGVPGVIAAAKANLDGALPKVYIDTAISVAQGQAEFAEGDLVKGFADVPDAALQAELKKTATETANNMREYAAWLKADRLPRATGDFAIGRDAFVRLLREQELITQTPEDILAIGLKELERKKAAFEAAAKEIDPTRSAAAVWEQVQHDHPTPQTLLSDTRAHLAEIRKFLVAHDIIRFPTNQEVIVDETPAFLRATSFASMDTPGVFEKKATESFYYVTPPEKEWNAAKTEEWLTAFNYYTTDVVSIHEALPGHFVQALHLKASDVSGAPRYTGSYAFIEGWAHYCEQMAIDEGFPPASLRTDPKALAKYHMAQASEALLRVCRLISSIRIHCQNQSLEDATKFFTENCYYPEQPARSEAERGSYDPGYCLYTVGKLQMFTLREDWRRQEGAAFSLRKFHDEVLRHGQPPIRLLRERMLRDESSWDRTLGN